MSSSVNSGLHIRICPIFPVNLTGLGTGTTALIWLAQHIESHTMTEADLIVRAHSPANASPAPSIGTGNLKIGLYADGYDFGDPTQGFFGSSALMTAITLNSGTALPNYQTASVSASFGRHLAVQLLATQVTAGQNLIAYISVELVLKGGDPMGLMNGPNTFPGYRIL